MWKKIITTLIIVAIALFVYAIIVFVQQNTEDKVLIDASIKNNDIQTLESEVIEQELFVSDTKTEDTSSGSSAFHITRTDCDNSCSNHEEATEIRHYCENVCGIIPIEKNQEDCKKERGLPRDYCLRDKAITAMDQKLCQEISDRTVMQQCVNRITENIVDDIF